MKVASRIAMKAAMLCALADLAAEDGEYDTGDLWCKWVGCHASPQIDIAERRFAAARVSLARDLRTMAKRMGRRT